MRLCWNSGRRPTLSQAVLTVSSFLPARRLRQLLPSVQREFAWGNNGATQPTETSRSR
jgi:hypothetical protein